MCLRGRAAGAVRRGIVHRRHLSPRSGLPGCPSRAGATLNPSPLSRIPFPARGLNRSAAGRHRAGDPRQSLIDDRLVVTSERRRRSASDSAAGPVRRARRRRERPRGVCSSPGGAACARSRRSVATRASGIEHGMWQGPCHAGGHSRAARDVARERESSSGVARCRRRGPSLAMVTRAQSPRHAHTPSTRCARGASRYLRGGSKGAVPAPAETGAEEGERDEIENVVAVGALALTTGVSLLCVLHIRRVDPAHERVVQPPGRELLRRGSHVQAQDSGSKRGKLSFKDANGQPMGPPSHIDGGIEIEVPIPQGAKAYDWDIGGSSEEVTSWDFSPGSALQLGGTALPTLGSPQYQPMPARFDKGCMSTEFNPHGTTYSYGLHAVGSQRCGVCADGAVLQGSGHAGAAVRLRRRFNRDLHRGREREARFVAAQRVRELHRDARRIRRGRPRHRTQCGRDPWPERLGLHPELPAAGLAPTARCLFSPSWRAGNGSVLPASSREPAGSGRAGFRTGRISALQGEERMRTS